MSKRHFRSLSLFVVSALALAACSTQPTQQTRAEMEAESARAFNQMRASMPLVTDRETIDFVACVAQAFDDPATGLAAATGDDEHVRHLVSLRDFR